MRSLTSRGVSRWTHAGRNASTGFKASQRRPWPAVCRQPTCGSSPRASATGRRSAVAKQAPQGVERIWRRIASPGGEGQAAAVVLRHGAEINSGGRCREAMQAVESRRMACMVEPGRRLPATQGELRGRAVPAVSVKRAHGLRESGLEQRACHS